MIKAIKTAGAEVWAGTTLSSITDGEFIATGNTTMSLRVFAPAAGKKVRMKVEDAADATKSVETEVLTTVANGWETLSFDFAQQAAGTAAFNNAHTYNKANVFFDFSVAGSGQTYYFDDLAYNKAALPDTTSPTVTSFSPVDGATGVSASANIVLNFSELVVARDGGTIQLMTDYNFNHQMIEEIAVNDTSKVQINGNVVTINPSADFQTGTGYHLGFVNAFADTSANAFSYPHGNYNFTVL